MRLLKEQFANRLKKAMQDKNLLQKDLADKMYVKPGTVSRWVTGDISPEDDKVESICKILGVSENYFIEPSELARKAGLIINLYERIPAMNESELGLLDLVARNIPRLANFTSADIDRLFSDFVVRQKHGK